MAHFAQLDSDNKVIQVVVVDNAEITDENGVEQEALGIQFLRNLLGQDTNWAQTSYNNNFRRRYAGKDYIFDETRNVFLEPHRYNSWTLDEDTLEWVPPHPMPTDGRVYIWDESITDWSPLN